jgi:hypothetical protein
VFRLLAAAFAVAAVPVPAWIQRAVPAPIVAWREADVLGTALPEGIAVSTAGGTYFVGIVDSRLSPPEEVLDYDLVEVVRGSSVRTLVASPFLGGTKAAIAVDVLVTPSIGEQAWILRVERGRLRLARKFSADRITISGRTVSLRWLTAGRSPRGTTHELWRYQRGAYRPIGP